MQRDEDSLDGEEGQGGESGRLSDCTLEIQATVLWAEGKKLHVCILGKQTGIGSSGSQSLAFVSRATWHVWNFLLWFPFCFLAIFHKVPF